VGRPFAPRFGRTKCGRKKFGQANGWQKDYWKIDPSTALRMTIKMKLLVKRNSVFQKIKQKENRPFERLLF